MSLATSRASRRSATRQKHEGGLALDHREGQVLLQQGRVEGRSAVVAVHRRSGIHPVIFPIWRWLQLTGVDEE